MHEIAPILFFAFFLCITGKQSGIYTPLLPPYPNVYLLLNIFSERKSYASLAVLNFLFHFTHASKWLYTWLWNCPLNSPNWVSFKSSEILTQGGDSAKNKIQLRALS